MEKELLRQIQEPLIKWFDKNARVLPWREHPLPYYVWVSEIMLQQTRVEAVKPYFARFTEALPNVRALADCPEDQLLKLWEGLGYYNRVRNMQKAARQVVEQYDGCLPGRYEELLRLPGIGSYTAGAIASIACGEAVPAVDGNVLRVLGRITENDGDISKQAVKKSVEEALLAVMPQDRPGSFNQALMELGAMVCVPNGFPSCDLCPVGHLCRANLDGRQTEFPVKAPKKPRRIEERTVLVIRDSSRAALRRRPERGLLAGLYELPNWEGHLTQQEALDRAEESGFSPVRIQPLSAARHIFSHVEWDMIGYLIFVEDCGEPETGQAKADCKELCAEQEKPDCVELRAGQAKANHRNRRAEQVESGHPEENRILCIEPERIRRDYPIPAAFAAYTKALFQIFEEG
ncbi:MAG: A/G-specific adenine glycosylase [Lachnospiraceae bacterium]|nr:A/G-specific adenine glycosylase [Lachnospiraceae bacterium]